MKKKHTWLVTVSKSSQDRRFSFISSTFLSEKDETQQAHEKKSCESQGEEDSLAELRQQSGKRKAHKLKILLGTPVGCPWDTRRDKQGPTGRCPRDFLLFSIEKLAEKHLNRCRQYPFCDTTPKSGTMKMS